MAQITRKCQTCEDKKRVDGNDLNKKFAPCTDCGGTNFTFQRFDIIQIIIFGVLGVFLVGLVISATVFGPNWLCSIRHCKSPSTLTPTSIATTIPIVIPSNLLPRLDEIPVPGGEPGQMIGVNDGTFLPFDIYRLPKDTMGNLAVKSKITASSDWKNKQFIEAQTAWDDALKNESNDAETLIYQENYNVVHQSKIPFISFAVGLAYIPDSSDPKAGIGPDAESEAMLQGIYVAQKEFNDNNPTLHIRILIANVADGGGPNKLYVTEVAKQVVSIAKAENIVAVIDWLTSTDTSVASKIFADVNMPFIAPNATYDTLPKTSNFFRIVPPDKQQTPLLATYATKDPSIHAKKALVFVDKTTDLYSENIADDFEKDFENDTSDKTSTDEVTFTVGQTEQHFEQSIRQAAQGSFKPDVIFFTSPLINDMKKFEEALKSTGTYANIPIMAGSAGYEIQKITWNNLYFLSLAFPDAWFNEFKGNPPDKFARTYCQTFDTSNNLCKAYAIYGLNRAPEQAILWYDASTVLVKAIEAVQGKGKVISSSNLLPALPGIKFQGVSGQISFDTYRNPIDKAMFILHPNSLGQVQQVSLDMYGPLSGIYKLGS